MPGEVPFDVLPAAFGRFRVLHQTAVGSLGPVFRGEDQETHQPVAIKQLRLNVPLERARDVADQLRGLVGRVPDHPSLTRIIDAGLYQIDRGGQVDPDERVDSGHVDPDRIQNAAAVWATPYVVTSFAAGESLDVALREYGAAAILDALPRLRGLADALDGAAAQGVWHGSLHPRDILVSATETQLSGLGIRPILDRAGVRCEPAHPYVAPEVTEGQPSSPAADQFSLASIAHEWLLGKLVPGSTVARLELYTLPNVDGDVLADALTRALARDPLDRFPSTTAFVEAMEAALSHPERLLPATLADVDIAGLEFASEPSPRPQTLEWEDSADSGGATPVEVESAVRWQGSFAAVASPDSTAHEKQGFGIGTLVGALVAGIIIGSTGGYLFGTGRALPNVGMTPAAGTEPLTTQAPPSAEPPNPTATQSENAPERSSGTAAIEAPTIDRPDIAPASRAATASLLVRSTPGGANVTVDGTPRGVTPLALRALDLGTRTVVVSRPGYAPVERSITLTADRPSRSMEVALPSVSPPVSRTTPTSRTAEPPMPGAASTAGTGSLVVESRPSGATVTIDGRPAGTTPLTVPTLTAGRYIVRIARAGYRPWTTTIDITAGERSRAAASLVGGQQE